MDESAHNVTSSNPVRIEAEIAQTRAEMQDTISAIQERLAPANVLERAKHTAREATVGRVKQMAHEFGNRASSMTEAAYESAAPRVRDNSMPLALIGIGIGWLVARNWSHSRDVPSPMVGTDWSDNPWVEDEWEHNTRTISTAGERRSTLGEATGSMRDTAARGTERMRDAASASAERMRSAASQGAERVSQTARRTRSGLERAMRDNPLAIGMATLAAGLAVGALLPHTEVEDEYLGSTRDTMMHKARETAQGAIEQVTGKSSEGGGPSASQTAV